MVRFTPKYYITGYAAASMYWAESTTSGKYNH